MDGVFIENFEVRLLSSRAIAKPRIEISKAVSLIYQGIVRTGMFVGGILSEIRKPAKILPNASRLMGLMRSGLLSSIMISGE